MNDHQVISRIVSYVEFLENMLSISKSKHFTSEKASFYFVRNAILSELLVHYISIALVCSP